MTADLPFTTETQYFQVLYGMYCTAEKSGVAERRFHMYDSCSAVVADGSVVFYAVNLLSAKIVLSCCRLIAFHVEISQTYTRSTSER